MTSKSHDCTIFGKRRSRPFQWYKFLGAGVRVSLGAEGSFQKLKTFQQFCNSLYILSYISHYTHLLLSYQFLINFYSYLINFLVLTGFLSVPYQFLFLIRDLILVKHTWPLSLIIMLPAGLEPAMSIMLHNTHYYTSSYDSSHRATAPWIAITINPI